MYIIVRIDIYKKEKDIKNYEWIQKSYTNFRRT